MLSYINAVLTVSKKIIDSYKIIIPTNSREEKNQGLHSVEVIERMTLRSPIRTLK